MWELAGWICGGGVGLGAIGFVITYFVGTRMMAKDQERFERDGELCMCWISSAGPDMYKVHDVPGAGNARVVFITDEVPNRKAVLKELTARLTNGEKEDDSVDRAKVNAFFEKINKQTYLDPPVRMPEWLVGDCEAYTGMMQLYWRKLPDLKLTKPFVYGRVILGEGGGIRHVRYPEKDRREAGSE